MLVLESMMMTYIFNVKDDIFNPHGVRWTKGTNLLESPDDKVDWNFAVSVFKRDFDFPIRQHLT